MTESQHLYMMLLGCKPAGRFTEQHDIYFGVGKNLQEAAQGINEAWPEAAGDIHIDAWRKVNKVDGYEISIASKQEHPQQNLQVFFVNLGGYQPNEMEERHFKVLVVAENEQAAKNKVRQASFFKTHIHPHVDDHFAIDVDDIFSVSAYLQATQNIYLQITPDTKNATEDSIQNGYFQLHLLKETW